MKVKKENVSIRRIMKQHRIPLTDAQQRYLRQKRCFDVVIAAMALVVLAVPFAAVALLQKLSSPTEPVFFRQKRVGQDSHVFYITKFRTMKSTAPKYSATGELQNADAYISRLGRFLRDTSIDELPQLFNVLTGDMSLIGPRPLIRQERSVHFLRRYYGVDQLKPGITGWAQINGRDMLNDYDKVFYDREYLKNVSMAFDAKVFLDTVLKVLGRKDIQEGVQAHHHRDEVRRSQPEQLAQEKAEKREFMQFQQEAQLVREHRRAM